MESRFHGERDLLEQANDFERVVKASEKYCDAGQRLSRILSVFFGMKSAFLVCRSLGPEDNDHREAAMDGAGDFEEQPTLLKFDTVHSALQKLAAAVASNDGGAAMSALEEMGVFALCPIPDEQLSRMERLAGTVSGRARLVFLVELSLFAVELGDFDAARKYVTEAWGLAPSGWELYNFSILEGFFALEAGKTEKAVQYLERSLRACQTDEHTLINCGLRPPNFLLARKLFELGTRGAVIKHLVDCKNVWQRSWIPLDEWINLIESGQTPDFDSEGLRGMSLPSCRLDLQWMRARSLESKKGSSLAAPNSKSPAEVVAAKERLLADVDRHISAKVKDAISYLDKGPVTPPDQPPSNPKEPGPSE
jgi:tetratricopeptide (TPR) repeat protein